VPSFSGAFEERLEPEPLRMVVKGEEVAAPSLAAGGFPNRFPPATR